MSVYRATSWGRTARPKAPDNQDNRPLGANHITGAASLAALNALPNTASFTRGNACYRTENQRYAHIMTSGSATVTDVCLYTYAGGYWQSLHTGSTSGKVQVGEDSHRVVEIYGADWISLVTGSGGKVTLAFSTF